LHRAAAASQRGNGRLDLRGKSCDGAGSFPLIPLSSEKELRCALP
jgi:hypothetical protein